MAVLHVSAPESRSDTGRSPADQPGPDLASRSQRRPPDPSSGSAPHRPRPRTRPPSFNAGPAPRVYASQSLSERLLPPLFFGFIALVVLGSAAMLLWTPSTQTGYTLTSEELRILEGTASATQDDSTARTTPARPASETVTSGSAQLHVETVQPGAVVSIDGEVVGVTPFRQQDMPSRWHIVSLERPGFGAKDTLVFLEDEALTTISLALLPAEGGAASGPSPEEGVVPRTAVPPVGSPSAPEAASGAPPPSAPATGSISVAVNPAGVPVQLDGKTVGVAPMELGDVTPGPHTMTFFLPGYETATVSVNVRPGANEVVDIALVPQTGTLVVVARPWGSIYVNGELEARDTDVSVEVTLPVGSHQVRVEHPSLGVEERTVEVRPERTTTAAFDLN